MGTQQSGVLNLKIADIVKDNQILKSARFYAMKLLKDDPNLEEEDHIIVRYTYNLIAKDKTIWNYIS
jgi:ATP-dependent DNA helicase RecG